MDAQYFGKAAENYAVYYLKRKQFKILKRNYRYLKAEVDIIALHEKTLIIVEVKGRTSTLFGDPETFITKKKIALLTLATNQFVQENELDVSVRFDIVAVLRLDGKWEVNHIENAFYAFDGNS